MIPAITKLTGAFLCQGSSGIGFISFENLSSRTTSLAFILPVIPPKIVNGKVTTPHINNITTIVPNGIAAEEP